MDIACYCLDIAWRLYAAERERHSPDLPLKWVNRLVRGVISLRGRFGLHINLPDMERSGAVWSGAERTGVDVKSGAGRTEDGEENEADG